MESHVVNLADALAFITGGNALFTITLRDETRFTYKVMIDQKGNKNELRVYVLNGPDNTSNYKRFGTIVVTDGVPQFHPFAHERFKKFTEIFDVVFLNITIGQETAGVKIYHSGRCCRCGRVLTVPDSIISGIGPECAFKQSFVNISKIFTNDHSANS